MCRNVTCFLPRLGVFKSIKCYFMEGDPDSTVTDDAVFSQVMESNAVVKSKGVPYTAR